MGHHPACGLADHLFVFVRVGTVLVGGVTPWVRVGYLATWTRGFARGNRPGRVDVDVGSRGRVCVWACVGVCGRVWEILRVSCGVPRACVRDLAGERGRGRACAAPRERGATGVLKRARRSGYTASLRAAGRRAPSGTCALATPPSRSLRRALGRLRTKHFSCTSHVSIVSQAPPPSCPSFTT